MKTTLAVAAIVVLTISCKDKDTLPTVCGVVDPVTELPWLKAKVEARANEKTEFQKKQYLTQADYEGNWVFFFGICCPNCNYLIEFYDCDGNVVTVEDYTKLKKQTVIWKPEGFECMM